MPSMVGTIASMLSRSNELKKGTFIMSLARNLMEDSTKVSLRIAGRKNDVDLRELVDKIAQNIPGAEAGGHKEAAGALIPTEKEQQFIEEAQRVLKLNFIEERVE